MKPPGQPRRSRPIARGERIKPVGEGKRKKMQRYAKKLAAYRQSATYQVVEDRAGGMCERTLMGYRCTYVGPLTHNHKTYARFGGKELPEDVEAICPRHHAVYESERPWRASARRASLTRKER